MRLATLRVGDATTAARHDGAVWTEVSGYANVSVLLGEPGWRAIAEAATGQGHKSETATFDAVAGRSGSIFCVGLNYRSHILEMGRPLPEYPTLFAKYNDTVTGPNDDIPLPEEDTSIDWEGELAFIIGREGRRIPETEAKEHIAGFTVCNDISMRTWQFRTNEWLQGKIWEATTPIGPALVTVDEWQPGPSIRTVLDGETVQEASTADLAHGPEFLVSYISTMITLRPGDVIITGTPGGVGHARTPQRYLQPGQRLETVIDGLGHLSNLTTRG